MSEEFHALKVGGEGYAIIAIDREARAARWVKPERGSSLYKSRQAAAWHRERESTTVTKQDVLDFLASCQHDDVIDEPQTCYGNLISKAYKFKHGKDLAIAAQWGKNFEGDEYWRPSQLAAWMKALLQECEALTPDRYTYLRKSAAIGKLPSIGF